MSIPSQEELDEFWNNFFEKRIEHLEECLGDMDVIVNSFEEENDFGKLAKSKGLLAEMLEELEMSKKKDLKVYMEWVEKRKKK